MHICVVGHVCIDKNTTEHASYTSCGGPAVFMQKVFTKLPDADMKIFAPYAKDFLQFAVDLPLATLPANGKTLVYENTMKGKTRTQKAKNRSTAELLPLAQMEKSLSTADILFLAPLLPNFTPLYVKSLIDATDSNMLKVLLPQGYYRDFAKDDRVVQRQFEEASAILPLMDIVVVSEQDAENMEETAREWSVAYGVISIVTLGEKGAVAFEKGERLLLPTKPVDQNEIVDSVGSGDIFTASFAYAYRRTQSLEKAGKFANEIARQCLFYPADTIQFTPPQLQR